MFRLSSDHYKLITLLPPLAYVNFTGIVVEAISGERIVPID